MVSIRVAFANICQGLKSEGQKNNRDVFSKYWPSAYQESYVQLNPDVMCMAEVPLDDEHGNSRFLSAFSREMGAMDCRADVLERSWLVEDKYYGNAIISKFAFKEYTTQQLPNPKFEIDNPDGSHWHLHDKTVQGATVELDGNTVRVFNLHYFPFHRFGHDINEPALRPIRTAFVEQLRLDEGVATILTGDFNNGHNNLETAYPELFEDDRLKDAVKFSAKDFINYYPSDKFQLDHILCTQHFTVEHTEVIHDNSDHRGVLADFALAF
jgi:endonuclease/exonuclease/phosphatase family metal-dependent hydrolase